jgi:hypothetical protein
MNLKFTYQEVATIASSYIQNNNKENLPQITLIAIPQGFLISVKEVKVSFLNLGTNVKLRIKKYEDGVLYISLKFKSIFVEALKKLLFVTLVKSFKNKSARNGNEVLNYIQISSENIMVEVNKISEFYKAPVSVGHIDTNAESMEIIVQLNDRINNLGQQDENDYTPNHEHEKLTMP